MRTENRILIVAGLALIAATIFFGLWYAIFDEHQTLVGMVESLTSAFAQAASGNLDKAHAAIDQYASTAAEYRLEVHFHGHFGFLGLIMVLLGLVAHTLGFNAANRKRLAAVLGASGFLFPVGVLLQIGPLASAGHVLAVIGTVGVVLGMLIFVAGLLRAGPEAA
jgi:hypothetical protein